MAVVSSQCALIDVCARYAVSLVTISTLTDEGCFGVDADCLAVAIMYVGVINRHAFVDI